MEPPRNSSKLNNFEEIQNSTMSGFDRINFVLLLAKWLYLGCKGSPWTTDFRETNYTRGRSVTAGVADKGDYSAILGSLHILTLKG